MYLYVGWQGGYSRRAKRKRFCISVFVVFFLVFLLVFGYIFFGIIVGLFWQTFYTARWTAVGSQPRLPFSRARFCSDIVVQSVCLCTSGSSIRPSSAVLSASLSVLSILQSCYLLSFCVHSRDHYATIPYVPVPCSYDPDEQSGLEFLDSPARSLKIRCKDNVWLNNVFHKSEKKLFFVTNQEQRCVFFWLLESTKWGSGTLVLWLSDVFLPFGVWLLFPKHLCLVPQSNHPPPLDSEPQSHAVSPTFGIHLPPAPSTERRIKGILSFVHSLICSLFN